MDDIAREAERKHLEEQNRLIKRIEAEYYYVINKISPLISASAVQVLIDRKLNELLIEASKNITAEIILSNQRTWQYSNDKTIAYLDRRLASSAVSLPDSVKKVLYDPNEKALASFQKRKVKGLDLSQRVWKSTKEMRTLIAAVQEDGIAEGKSATKVAQVLRKQLVNPTVQVNPGQGVYKSPLANAMRVARTEMNMANRMADQVAYEANPIILGYRINLSNTNSKKVRARCELCKGLAGEYPVEFVWTMWHPSCLCYKTPILMTREFLDKYNKLIATGQDSKENIEKLRKEAGAISKGPSAFGNWVASNHERVGGWKQPPMWWGDNLKVVKGFIEAS